MNPAIGCLKHHDLLPDNAHSADVALAKPREHGRYHLPGRHPDHNHQVRSHSSALRLPLSAAADNPLSASSTDSAQSFADRDANDREHATVTGGTFASDSDSVTHSHSGVACANNRSNAGQAALRYQR